MSHNELVAYIDRKVKVCFHDWFGWVYCIGTLKRVGNGWGVDTGKMLVEFPCESVRDLWL